MIVKQLYGDAHYNSTGEEDWFFLKRECIERGGQRIHFNLKDVIRATVYVTSTDQILEVIKLVQSEFGVKEIKNKLYDNSAAYACVYVIFLFKGILAEL